MTTLKTLVCDWLPPAVVRLIRRRQGPQQNGGLRFEGDFATWEEASAQCTGYDAEDILAKVLAATLKVRRGEAAFERDSVLFDDIEYAWPLLAGLMWAAARNGGKLNVLDFGGALGSSYFQNRNFLQTLPDVRWNIIEQAHYVEAGQAHIQDEQLLFYKSIEECIAENQPNVILLSGVLQYLHDPAGVLEEISKVRAEFIVIDRTPIALSGQQVITVQQVPEEIIRTSYPTWLFEENTLKAPLLDSYNYVYSFPAMDGRIGSGVLAADFKGFIFRRR